MDYYGACIRYWAPPSQTLGVAIAALIAEAWRERQFNRLDKLSSLPFFLYIFRWLYVTLLSSDCEFHHVRQVFTAPSSCHSLNQAAIVVGQITV